MIEAGGVLHLFQGDAEIRLRPEQGRHVVGYATAPSRVVQFGAQELREPAVPRGQLAQRAVQVFDLMLTKVGSPVAA